MTSNLRRHIAFALLGFTMASPATAQTAKPPAAPAYVGTWSIEAANCKLGQEQEGAPLSVETKRLDQHEAHCEFPSVRQAGPARWTAQATCTVDGNKEKRRLALRAADGKLTVDWGDGVTTTYTRCQSK